MLQVSGNISFLNGSDIECGRFPMSFSECGLYFVYKIWKEAIPSSYDKSNLHQQRYTQWRLIQDLECFGTNLKTILYQIYGYDQKN